MNWIMVVLGIAVIAVWAWLDTRPQRCPKCKSTQLREAGGFGLVSAQMECENGHRFSIDVDGGGYG